MTVLVTGGAGFIGSNFVLEWFRDSANCYEKIVNLDLLTYAGNLENLKSLKANGCHVFVKGDIRDRPLIDKVLAEHRPRAIVHFAAESHVDSSIDDPGKFVRTNVDGTLTLLEATRAFYCSLTDTERNRFLFHHISTDEVYGALGIDDPPFDEMKRYEPNNPYSASKAASDHLVRAWNRTFGLPVITTNCSNNYGPYQFPEKLIPLMVSRALDGKPLPVYGNGQQIRDWIYVVDHCSAIRMVLSQGRRGEIYNIGGWNEKSNLDVIQTICRIIDELRPDTRGSYSRLITHVADRPGHDTRYATDASKLERELRWRPAETFETGIRKTVEWYLANTGWLSRLRNRTDRNRRGSQ